MAAVLNLACSCQQHQYVPFFPVHNMQCTPMCCMLAAAGAASACTSIRMMLHLQGTGQHCRDVGNELESITVVNTIGTATYTSSHPLWPVIRGNFGLMGIVSDITFRMDSNFENPYGEGGCLAILLMQQSSLLWSLQYIL